MIRNLIMSNIPSMASLNAAMQTFNSGVTYGVGPTNPPMVGDTYYDAVVGSIVVYDGYQWVIVADATNEAEIRFFEKIKYLEAKYFVLCIDLYQGKDIRQTIKDAVDYYIYAIHKIGYHGFQHLDSKNVYPHHSQQHTHNHGYGAVIDALKAGDERMSRIIEIGILYDRATDEQRKLVEDAYGKVMFLKPFME